jgi:hypothetical protein
MNALTIKQLRDYGVGDVDSAALKLQLNAAIAAAIRARNGRE